MIELKEYSLVELRKVLKIPEKQWERHRDKLLEYFKEFFDYEYIYKGRKYIFTIKQQYKEYVPIPRKNQAKEKPIKKKVTVPRERIIERTEPISISKGQDKIRDVLFNNNIAFKQEYNVSACGGRFDFAIFDENGLSYLIEYDGEQHYGVVEYWGGEEEYAKRKERDGRKNQWAKDQGVPLIRIPYTLKDVHLRDLVPKTSKYVWAS